MSQVVPQSTAVSLLVPSLATTLLLIIIISISIIIISRLTNRESWFCCWLSSLLDSSRDLSSKKVCCKIAIYLGQIFKVGGENIDG